MTAKIYKTRIIISNSLYQFILLSRIYESNMCLIVFFCEPRIVSVKHKQKMSEKYIRSGKWIYYRMSVKEKNVTLFLHKSFYPLLLTWCCWNCDFSSLRKWNIGKSSTSCISYVKFIYILQSMRQKTLFSVVSISACIEIMHGLVLFDCACTTMD